MEEINVETKKGRGSLITVIVILSLLVVSLGGYIVYDKFIANNDIKNNDNESKNNDDVSSDNVSSDNVSRDEISSDTIELQKGSFKITSTGDNGYGTVFVKGYVTVEEEYDCGDGDCEIDENTPKVNYVSFNILENENQDFNKYLTGLNGNSFGGENSIGLGCITNNILSYYNDSDIYGMKGYIKTITDTNKIMNSTIENPIVLELERLEFNGGSGAPACYSHITTIRIP